MTTFDLTQDQRALRDAARTFAREVIRPTALEVEKAGGVVPADLIRRMAGLGLTGLDIPREFGGQGFDALTSAILVEEIACGWFSAATYAVNMAVRPIVQAGTRAQKEKFVPGLCRGDLFAAFALTEPETGSDAASVRTRAVRDGDSWVVNGAKIYITNGARADVVVVFARTSDEGRGKGLTLFLVEQGAPGFSVGQRFRTLAHEANPIAELIFDNCRVPAENMLGVEGEAFAYMQRDFAQTRAIYGARCVGVAQAAMDYALQHAVRRKQFGQAIASFQGIRFKVADVLTKIEAARALTYRACALVDAGSAEAQVAASMAKNFASDVAVDATAEAIQIMGGHGFMRDHPVERFYREAKLFELGDGTQEVLRLLVSRDANKKAESGESARLD